MPWSTNEGEVDARALARAYGAKYIPSVGTVYTGTTLPEPLHPYQAPQWSVGALNEAILNRDPALTHPNTSTLTDSMGAITLRPGQEQAAQAIVAAHQAGCPEFLDASEVGTGKTYAALAAIRRLKAKRVLIIAPASVLDSWRLALKGAGAGGAWVTLVNPESLHHLTWHLPATSRTSGQAQAAKGGVGKIAWDVVVTDEGHTFRNPAANWTRIRERVINGPAGSAPAWSLVLSATAGRDPSDLAYLHRGISHALGVKDPGLGGLDVLMGALGVELGVSRFDGSLTWDPHGPTAGADLEAVHEVLFESDPCWAVRRVADWGAPPRHLVAVNLTPTQVAAYGLEWGRFKAEMARVEKEYAKARTGKAKATAKAKGLAAQLRYRQKAGLLRADGVAYAARQWLDKGYQVAISCEFLETGRHIATQLTGQGVPVAWFTGDNRDERDTERVAFQRGEKKVIVFTPTAGFSLHAGEQAVGGNTAPRVLLVAEPRWSPLGMLQVEGRTHRDGQEAPVYYFYAHGTVEKDVINKCVQGMSSTEALLGHQTGSLKALASALGVTRAW